MQEVIVKPTAGVSAGSVLLARDTVPILLAEGYRNIDIETRHIDTLSIDIKADVACTLQLIRLPDGETAGSSSDAIAIAAGTPANHTYSDVRCGWMRIKVTNTSGGNMTAFALYARGGA